MSSPETQVTEFVLAVSGEQFAALEFGDKADPTILCLHGFPDHPPTFTPLATELSALRYHVVVPYLRGYSPSPLTGSVSLPALTKDARNLVRATNATFLVGHDWGAAITYGVLGDSACELEAACAISVPHPVALFSNALRSPAQLRRSSYMARLQPGSADTLVQAQGFAWIRELWSEWSPGLAISDEDWSSLRQTLERSHPHPLHYYRHLPSAATLRFLRMLAKQRIGVRTTTIFGDDDGCIDASMARDSQRFFDGRYDLDVLPGVGHFIHVEAPSLLASRIDIALRTNS